MASTCEHLLHLIDLFLLSRCLPRWWFSLSFFEYYLALISVIFYLLFILTTLLDVFFLFLWLIVFCVQIFLSVNLINANGQIFVCSKFFIPFFCPKTVDFIFLFWSVYSSDRKVLLLSNWFSRGYFLAFLLHVSLTRLSMLIGWSHYTPK